jgi:hypothetical protein
MDFTMLKNYFLIKYQVSLQNNAVGFVGFN